MTRKLGNLINNLWADQWRIQGIKRTEKTGKHQQKKIGCQSKLIINLDDNWIDKLNESIYSNIIRYIFG